MRIARTLTTLLLAASVSALAGTWPERPIKLLVPSTAGSTPDVFARMLADGLTARLGQPVVVENKPGAGGMIAVAAAAKAAPDGYTLAVTPPGPVGIDTILYKKMPYDARQLSLISIGATQANVLVARTALGVDSIQEILPLLRAHPGKYTYASVGVGSINHLCMELLAMKVGSRMVQVPYPGTAQATLALIGGEVDFGCLPAQAIAGQVKSGKLKALAVATATRSSFFPELPTLKEAGVDGVEASAWMGVVGPADLPQTVVERLAQASAEVLKEPKVRAQLAAQYMHPVAFGPEQFRETVKADILRWQPVVRARGIRLD
jgi:tripartite-type tricarboxylate transporter receptor subunit TctC